MDTEVSQVANCSEPLLAWSFPERASLDNSSLDQVLDRLATYPYIIVRQVPVELYTIITIQMHVRGREIFRAETVCIWECARRMHVEVRGK